MTRLRFEKIPDITGPGIYKFFLAEGATLGDIEVDETRLLYVGITKNAKGRNHFTGNTAKSTLRRTVGAILKNAKEFPHKVYLRGYGKELPKDATHYRFSSDGE
jgi:hypothetical protein